MVEWEAVIEPEAEGSWVVQTPARVAGYEGGMVWLAYGLTETNARIIAAAPNLLKACTWLKTYAEVQVRNHPTAQDTPHWQYLLDAVAKAEPSIPTSAER